MEVYILDLKPLLPRLEEAMALLPPDRREKAAHLSRPEARLRSVGAGLLLRRFFGDRPLAFGPGGKPYIRGARQFNLSHSGFLAALAVGDCPVGVDVEVIGRVRDHVARRVFTAGEYAWQAARGPEGFYRLWTRKEAALKCLGTGLNRPLDSFSVLPGEETVLDGVALDIDTALCPGAALSAAAAGEKAEFTPRFMDIEELFLP